jgi:hypothetical protein
VSAIAERGIDGASSTAGGLENRGEENGLVIAGHIRKHSAPSGIPNGALRG